MTRKRKYDFSTPSVPAKKRRITTSLRRVLNRILNLPTEIIANIMRFMPVRRTLSINLPMWVVPHSTSSYVWALDDWLDIRATYYQEGMRGEYRPWPPYSRDVAIETLRFQQSNPSLI